MNRCLIRSSRPPAMAITCFLALGTITPVFAGPAQPQPQPAPIQVNPKQILIKLDKPQDQPEERVITLIFPQETKIKAAQSSDALVAVQVDLAKSSKQHQITVRLQANHTGILGGLILIALETPANQRLIVPFEVHIAGLLTADPPAINARRISRPFERIIKIRPADNAKSPRWISAESASLTVAVVTGRPQDSVWPIGIRVSPGPEGNLLFTHVRVRSSMDPDHLFLIPVSGQFAKAADDRSVAPTEIKAVLEQSPVTFPAGGVLLADAGEKSKEVVLFLDMRQPVSAQAIDLIESYLLLEYRDRLRIRVLQLPMDPRCNPAVPKDTQSDGFTGARALEAARMLGQANAFWLLSRQMVGYRGNLKEFPDAQWSKVAEGLKIPAEAFVGLLKSPLIEQQIRAQVALAAKLGITKSPAVFYEGRRVENWPDQALWRALILRTTGPVPSRAGAGAGSVPRDKKAP